MLLKDVLFCQINTFVRHGCSGAALYIEIGRQTSLNTRENSKGGQCENISIKQTLCFSAALWISNRVWSTRTKRKITQETETLLQHSVNTSVFTRKNWHFKLATVNNTAVQSVLSDINRNHTNRVDWKLKRTVKNMTKNDGKLKMMTKMCPNRMKTWKELIKHDLNYTGAKISNFQ